MHKIGSYQSQIIAGGISFLCLVAATLFVTTMDGSFGWIQGVVWGLALMQMMVQLVAFFHLNQETHPWYGWIFFWFTFLLMLIVVFGSIWIMMHLRYNMM